MHWQISRLIKTEDEDVNKNMKTDQMELISETGFKIEKKVKDLVSLWQVWTLHYFKNVNYIKNLKKLKKRHIKMEGTTTVIAGEKILW